MAITGRTVMLKMRNKSNRLINDGLALKMDIQWEGTPCLSPGWTGHYGGECDGNTIVNLMAKLKRFTFIQDFDLQ